MLRFFLFFFLRYNSAEVQSVYFAPFSHYNHYALGVLCAFLVKSKIKPKLIVSSNSNLK